MKNLKSKMCENCNESIAVGNYERHVKACIRGRRGNRLGIWKQCETCKDWFKGGQSNSHFQRGCNRKGKKKISYENCEKCNERISVSNMKRHKEVCGSKHKIRRKVKSLEKEEVIIEVKD